MVSELGKDALRRRPEGILFWFEGWQVISVFSPLWTPLIFVQLYSNMEVPSNTSLFTAPIAGGLPIALRLIIAVAIIAVVIVAVIIYLMIRNSSKEKTDNISENICPQCGRSIKNGNTFCTSCGTKIQ